LPFLVREEEGGPFLHPTQEGEGVPCQGLQRKHTHVYAFIIELYPHVHVRVYAYTKKQRKAIRLCWQKWCWSG